MASVLMINLRVLGIVGARQPLRSYSARFLPVIWWTLPILLATGLIMAIGEPVRSLESWVFQMKMCLLLLAIAVTVGYHAPLRKDSSYWERSGLRRTAAVLLAIVSLTVWVGIVFAGRWIAYA
jgi:hypothetical protein